MCQPAALRAEPRASWPLVPISATGRPNRSTRRAATIPITPGCHAGDARTMARSRPPLADSASAWANASARMEPSSSCRSRFCRSRSAASSRASNGSWVSSRRTAAVASSRRPAALIRGASPKATRPTPSPPGADSGIPATWARARRPGRVVPASWARPCFTRIRFSPSRGTRSAMVPRATRSRKGHSSSLASVPKSACSSLNAIPTPQRSLNG